MNAHTNQNGYKYVTSNFKLGLNEEWSLGQYWACQTAGGNRHQQHIYWDMHCCELSLAPLLKVARLLPASSGCSSVIVKPIVPCLNCEGLRAPRAGQMDSWISITIPGARTPHNPICSNSKCLAVRVRQETKAHKGKGCGLVLGHDLMVEDHYLKYPILYLLNIAAAKYSVSTVPNTTVPPQHFSVIPPPTSICPMNEIQKPNNNLNHQQHYPKLHCQPSFEIAPKPSCSLLQGALALFFLLISSHACPKDFSKASHMLWKPVATLAIS